MFHYELQRLLLVRACARLYLDTLCVLDKLELAMEIWEARTPTLAGARRRTEADIAAQLQYLKARRKERLIYCQAAAFEAAIVPRDKLDR